MSHSDEKSSTSREFKEELGDVTDIQAVDIESQEHSRKAPWIVKATSWLLKWGVELEDIDPIPDERRTNPRLYQLFFVWFSANANIFTMTAGTVGPAFYGLGIRDSFLIIVVVDIITCAFPAWNAVFGPKLGTRSMVFARFCWGYYAALIPTVLNVVSMQGYLIINTIIGGQTLGATSAHLGASLGIVIIGLLALLVTFCGVHILNWYETVAWIPNVITFIVMLGAGGKHLVNAPLTNAIPASAAAIMTFGATLAATNVSWATLTPDYGVYHDRKASSWRIFIYVYLGFIVSSMLAHLIGAAFTAAAFSVPSWQAGLGNGNDIGGLVGAILEPVGGFGKFLLVLVALTSPSACAPTMYTACTSFMTIAPVFAKVPRFLFAIASTALLIPVGIVGATKFYSTFVDILSIVGYWLAAHFAISLLEHFVFRRGEYSAYEVQQAWNKPRHPNLPRGYASLLTFACTVGLVVVCMDQVWYTGPIARAGTGDMGMLVGFLGGSAVYLGARWAERRWIVGKRPSVETIAVETSVHAQF